MTFQEGLNLVTLVMCIVTLTMASLALLPQIKLGLVIVRDSVLWAVLIGIVILAGAFGWKRFHEAQQRRSESVGATAADHNIRANRSRLSDEQTVLVFDPMSDNWRQEPSSGGVFHDE